MRSAVASARVRTPQSARARALAPDLSGRSALRGAARPACTGGGTADVRRRQGLLRRRIMCA
eukprot:5168877-Prymnesium_polylepis.1